MKQTLMTSLIVALGVTVSLHSMENTREPLWKDPCVPINNRCYLGEMSLDILNYIASFLIWETKADFIVRSKIAGEIPLSFYERQSFALATLNANNYFFPACEHTEALYAVTFDQAKIILLKVPCVECCDVPLSKPRLAIIDIATNTKEYEGIGEKRQYQKIALSPSGTMVATVQKQVRRSDEILSYYKDVVVIQKIVTQIPHSIQELQKIYLPDRFVSSVIAFNKQGTSLIVHGNDYSTTDYPQEHKIFSLKNSKHNNVVDKDKVDIMHDYFNHALVCKNIKSSIKQDNKPNAVAGLVCCNSIL